MITFTYRPYTGEKSGIKFIEWTAVWDGVHESSDHIHPFSGTCDYEERAAYFPTTNEPEDNPENLREVGEIVADNPVTRALCEALAKSLTELEDYSGNMEVVGYRNRLLVALDSLWD